MTDTKQTPKFIRLLTATEKKNNKQKNRAWNEFDPQEGFEITIMPYGLQGHGFYVVEKLHTPNNKPK